MLPVRSPRASGGPSAARSKGPRARAPRSILGAHTLRAGRAPRTRRARPSPDACAPSSRVRSACDAVGRGGSAEEAYARSPETAGTVTSRTRAPVPAGSGREARVRRRSRVPAPRATMEPNAGA